jgi:hypothetical protein
MRIVDSGDKKAIPALRWALDDRDNENKRNAAFALGKIGGAETAVAVPALLQAAKDGDLETRRLTIMVIRNIGPAAADAVPELVRYLREDKDEGVRIAAAVALGGLGKSAVPAINALVERIGDSAETRDVRMECCMAMSRMGSNPDTMNVAPTLLGILGDSRHDARVREKVWWTLKVHGGNLNKVKGCFETFSAVCKEAPSVENKMLRYNCAYLLGMIWQHDAPDQTLVVLSEFLQDKSIQIFDSVQFKSGVIKVDEGKGGEKGEVKIKGKGDGRVMACDALKMIGPDRYAKRQEIMNQLRLLANDATIYQPLREKSAELHKAGQ